MRVIVTGGEGFVGSNLIKHLVQQDEIHSVFSLDNQFTSSKDNIVHNKKVRYWTGSTTSINRILMNWDVDAVFHFGEYSRIDPSFDDLDDVFNYNMKGTWEVIQYCKKKKIPMIYSGSSSKFGHDKNQHLSPYAWTKAKNTEIIKNFSDWFGLEYKILYFHNVYGPGQIMEGKYATVIGIFEKQVENDKPITVVSPGSQRRDFTHVDDIVDGIWKAYKNAPPNTEFSLGTGTNYSIMEIAEAFDHTIEVIPSKRGERNTSLADIENTTKVLKWRPTIDVIEYIKNKRRK